MPLPSDDTLDAGDTAEGTGSPPQDGWLAAEHRQRLEGLIRQLETSNTRESVSRYHAMAEGYLLGLLDCNHVSAQHHDAVNPYLHTLALRRLKRVKSGARR